LARLSLSNFMATVESNSSLRSITSFYDFYRKP
jgi:hypothetical protein